jgi:uncharacterized membrane protein
MQRLRALARWRTSTADAPDRRVHAFDASSDSMNRYFTAGLTIAAGAALLEAALIPGIVIGAAAVLAPAYLPKLRRGIQSALDAVQPASAPAPGPTSLDNEAPVPAARAFGIKRAVAKTITYRIIVTTLDFTSNIVVIGELATAAGLSTFALVAGPLFYFGHETVWNYFGPAGDTVELSARSSAQTDTKSAPAPEGGFTISRALAKTITFRTIATVVDFSATYVVVGNAATAAILTSFGFVVGPFVYFGHEKLWDYYSPPPEEAVHPPAPVRLLPAPV